MRECPNHGGSFDCTPFCNLCEGNQEYQEERYFRIKFANVAHEVYEYGENAKAAIWNALDELLDGGHPEPLGAATARPAVYKEWSYGSDRYTIGGGFQH